MKKILLVLGLFLLFPHFAEAQTTRNPCYLNGQQSTNGIPSCVSVSTTNPLPITGTISATSTVKATAAAPSYAEGSTQPFSSDLNGNIRTLASVSVGTYQPGGTAANIASVTTTSSNVALPAGSVVAVFNTGTVPVITKLGTSGAVSVTAVTGDVIQPGSWFSYSVGANTFIAAITGSSTSSLVITGGSGLPSGAGGGSSSGGGGAVTVANGADVAQGSTTDAPAATPTTTTAATLVSLVKSLVNTALTPLPAQSNTTTNIGSVTLGAGNSSKTNTAYTTSATVSTATQVLASSTTRKVVQLQVQGVGVVCFSFTSTTPTCGAGGNGFRLGGETTSGDGKGGTYTTPIGFVDQEALYAASPTASIPVYVLAQ